MIPGIKALPYVMLVDDNDVDLIITKKILGTNELGQIFIEAKSGSEALEYLGNCIDNHAVWPTVIFLDLTMPISDGFTFLESLAGFIDEIPVKIDIHVLTSSTSRKELERVMRFGFVKSFIIKPLKQEMVGKLLN